MLENRVKKLELIVRRLSRKSSKKRSALLTPYPIHFTTTELIDEFTFMFPCDGTILRAAIALDNKPKKSVIIEAIIKSDVLSNSVSKSVDRKYEILEINSNVKCFDILEIETDIPEDSEVSSLHVSLLWLPSVSDHEVKSFLITELENDNSEE